MPPDSHPARDSSCDHPQCYPTLEYNSPDESAGQSYPTLEDVTQDSERAGVASEDCGVPATAVQAQLDKISEILGQVEALRGQVTSFAGRAGSKSYVYLEESLMSHLLSLDSTQTFGLMQVRSARKNVATAIQDLLAVLESRAVP
jgi:hypothetical protein